MIRILLQNPLLLLFLVVAVGYPIGRIKIRGVGIGVTAVLFVGLAFGALHPQMKLPEVLYQLGLILYLYTVGLVSGPNFVETFRKQGVRDNLLVAGILVGAAALVYLLFRFFFLDPPLAVGLFTGSLTSTPALAATIETIKRLAPPEDLARYLAEPVIAYSITYPMGVLGTIAAILLMQRVFRVDYKAESRKLYRYGATKEPLHSVTIRVCHPNATIRSIEELSNLLGWDVIFGRIMRAGRLAVAMPDTRLETDDLVTVVGRPAEVARVVATLGEVSDFPIDYDRSEIDFRRIFVSSPQAAGRRLKELHLEERFGAVVTRVRRGDIDLLPRADTVLEPGDRVRVVAHRDRMDEIGEFFGDSYRAVSEVDILTFSLGLAAGLLIGLIPIPIPGGSRITLGFAGGPLIVGLFLGTVERTGGLVWNLPYSANLTLRQIGLVLFLAGVGTRAGYGFFATLASGDGLFLFVAGAIFTCVTVFTMLWVGYRFFKVPMSILVGMVAGLQTQSAVLGFAQEQTRNDLPNIGYAEIYPLAIVIKVVLVQVLLIVMPLG